VSGLCAALTQYSHNVVQRLARLIDEVVRFEFGLGVPADLAGDEDATALGAMPFA